MANRLDRKTNIFSNNTQVINSILPGRTIVGPSECTQMIMAQDRATVYDNRYNNLRIKINNNIARNDFDNRYYPSKRR